MNKATVLLLVAALNGTPMSSKYLLVQLEDTNDKIIAPLDDQYGNAQGRELKQFSINSAVIEATI